QAARLAIALLCRTARARIPRVLMDIEEQHRTIAPEDFLGAISMMYVPVRDEDSVDAVTPDGVARPDGDVVEDTETHSAVGGRMVPGRTHCTKCSWSATRHDSVNG